jgi:transposase-like protein
MPLRRRTADQWQALIGQHAVSGLSLADFCRKKNISPSSFHRWRRKLHPETDHSGFLELEPHPSAEEPTGTWLLEVDLPGGGSLRIRWGQ